MSTSWQLAHNGTTPRFKAEFPAQSNPPAARHVRLSVGNERQLFICGVRPYAAGDQVWVAPDALRGVPDNTDVQVERVSAYAFLGYRMLHDAQLGLGLLSLAIGVVAALITGAIAVGVYLPLVTVSVSTLGVLAVITLLLQVLGLLVTYIKDVAKAAEE